ncbi:MAG: phenylalanine--tRNA ligase subunit alpha [Chloroflexi bacterium]|nr:phenylalanine--tRNA ligase subunit alpha [Chloroflexota bacterium]
MIAELSELQATALRELAAVDTAEALEVWRQGYLGKKGLLTTWLRGLGALPTEQRPEAGRQANEAKRALEEAFAVREEALKRAAAERDLAAEAIDVRLPGRAPQLGHLHISTQTLREIYAIFGRMGFDSLTGPEVEDDVTNFQMLNIPPDHPARDMWSTFYLTQPGLLLRTHTSPGQVYAMRQYHPKPFRVILPGKCYRYEQVTTRSEEQFHQVEGMAVGRNITMTDLKGVLAHFAHLMFGAERDVRFRPSYFPFTEPSAEVDISCSLCGGKGCQLCKFTGWIEILGCGMVHPQVLRNGGYDPDEYTGFAFGMGPERMCMRKHGINDIRLFFGNDLRFLHQFV